MLKFLGALIVVSAANTVRDCSSGSSLFKFDTASLLPDPIVPGQDSTLSLSCTIPDGVSISDGTAVYGTTLNGIPFPSTNSSLCSQVACPLTAGVYSNSTTSPFPAGVTGKIVTTIRWYDVSSVLLYCLEMTVRI